MSQDKLSVVLRILDNESQLIERADRKAIALLSILGVFMVFFVVYYRLIPVNTVTVSLTASYFALAMLAIASLVMTVHPRIVRSEENNKKGDKPSCEPAFFAGICKFPNLAAYREALGEMINSETATFDIYSRQVFSLAQINAAKYKHVQRATILTVTALALELIIVVYIFANYMGAGIMPPLI
jgi:hypothetical protein